METENLTDMCMSVDFDSTIKFGSSDKSDRIIKNIALIVKIRTP